MARKATCAILLFLMCIAPLRARDKKLVILRHEDFVFENKDCETSQTCSLKRVKYVVEDYKTGFSGEYRYGTRLFAKYETSLVRNLEQFAFVQFMKGCVYFTRAKDGMVLPRYRITVRNFGKDKKFQFSRWVVDSDWDDPIYSSVNGSSFRHYNCRWNKVPGSLQPKTEKLYKKNSQPPFPELYVIDRPAGAFVVEGVARNISLQFKICIYRTWDVPKRTTPENIDFAQPINCFEWDSSFIYNHEAGEFERHAEISSACE